MGEKTRSRYTGDKVNVEWDSRVCIHIGECGRAKGDLFVAGRKPWCVPDLVSPDEVIHVVERCPTGALTYHFNDSSAAEQPAEKNTVTVAYNGPYFIRGDLRFELAPEHQPRRVFRAALCRCGRSKNKPFCDNSHEEAGFRDFGAVGETGELLGELGGPLRINPLKNGPLMLTGNATIHASSGRAAWTGTQVALCRCGGSNNKPFCDGSHARAGFKE